MASTKPNKEDRKGLDRISPDIPGLSFGRGEPDPSINDRLPPSRTAALRVEPGHPQYRDLYVFWKKAGDPSTFLYGADQWMVINDSGTVFVLKGGAPASEHMYGQTSWGGKGT
jgi:hypothetical protein